MLKRKELLAFSLPESWVSTRAFSGPQYEWAWASELLVDQLFALERDRAALFKEFIKGGAIGVFLRGETEWISYAWMMKPGSMGPPHLPRKIRKQPNYWICYCRTKSAYQGRGAYKQNLYHLADRARSINPKADVFIDTEVGNVASQKGILKVGFVPHGRIRTIAFSIPCLGTVTFGKWDKKYRHSELKAT
ncbi:MAG TPA: GNAT family N-acetyltransferase [Candidatus Aminicenantes bacterium]|nr:GNAT family N-acetyltransferase [Candidatus Aminicenantes bacterium]HRY65750.1 GNAT family N-acetyltransferase [Candidatus Aminicenantes bacterium]HRZ72664.1 GNAT family N-acetyltransferase [Candidatus Aminicenantes bacterium]